MKATTLIVLGGLLFAGTAIAAEPQQAASTESGAKVGIDPNTGKLRRLTAAESAQLDAMAAKASQAAAAKGQATTAKGKVAAKSGLNTFVATNGMTVAVLDESYMSEVHATIGADGKIIVSHDGQPVQGAVEAANE
jgi:hypothetical protein